MNNIFHIFIIAVFSGRLRVAFPAAAVYKIFKMLYGVNKLLSTYKYFQCILFWICWSEICIFIKFSLTTQKPKNVFRMLIAYCYYSFETNDFSNVIIRLQSCSFFLIYEGNIQCKLGLSEHGHIHSIICKS